MNGYNLLRAWFNFRFENPDKCRAIHTEMYCYLVDQWNRLGQKEKIGLPTGMTMEMLGIGSYNTYKKTLDALIEFGFIKLVSESKNQWQSKIIALSKNDKALDKPLDKATAKARDEAPDKASDTISKQVNNRTTEQSNKGRFTPPAPTQVSDYAKERGATIDGERFCDFYASKGWMVGKNKMKDWKAAVRNWVKDKKKDEPVKPVKTYVEPNLLPPIEPTR